MKRYLYHDLIIAGNWCNLKCSYCTSVEDANAFGSNTSASHRRRGATIALADVLDMVDGLRRYVDAPVIKVSGGELFLLANAVELIAELSSRYAHVQVLTNGTEVTPEIVSRLAQLGNVGFNLSLDGHTPEMNAMRWRSHHIGARVTAAFAAMVKECEVLEITSVISDANAPAFPSFLEFLQNKERPIIVVPIPVRGPRADALFSPAVRAGFADLLRGIHRVFADVLCPPAYHSALADFLDVEHGRRRQRCHLANAAIQLFDTGAVTPCPVGWTAEIGNMKKDGPEGVAAQVGVHKMYDLLTRERPRVPVCRNCFSQADIVNLYIEGAIDIAEIARMPLFRAPAAQARLVELKAAARHAA
ncbi:MAG: radical SAM protein [Hyphomicrobiales bacterium]|nr:radical SAM protein [Hyphomicrobiales bacterium]MBV8825974.1 radical SAM protein [Hyphomicrobiales bacterium]MBV9428539.1 radical SAM protein [Bradyrhizobiaceae bacterium]